MITNNLSYAARGAVIILLGTMLAILLSTALQESAIMDELAHIPAGYSYLKYQDMRINPEHPPLLKDISAFPLLFLRLKFPEQSKAWVADINGQWDLGKELLYHSGNNPDVILFWARLGPIFLTILFGFLLFKLGSEFFGVKTALLALTFFAFSPAILAHGKYVTTDVAAAFGFFTAIFYFLRYLESPSRKNLILSGVFFGIAQSLKFSLVLLVPFFIGILILWALSRGAEQTRKEIFLSARRLFGKVILIFAIGYIVIVWPLYQFHVWNYPASPFVALGVGGAAPNNQAQRNEILTTQSCGSFEKQTLPVSQLRDTACALKPFKLRPLANLIVWMSDKPLLRPYAQYALGVLMVGTRTVGGNTTYFLGEVSRSAWRYYFPIVYLIKEPLAMHVLSFIALLTILAAALKLKFSFKQERRVATILWLKKYFVQITVFLFVIFYFGVSIAGNLNIGIRHIIPTFPFIFLLTSDIITRRLEKYSIVIGVLVVWYVISALAQYPYFISYFNNLAGGSANGYKYVADSNLDWGQDLKRLTLFVERNHISKIHLNYFGGGSPEYYLGDKYMSWWSAKGPEPGWHAVSATFLDEAFGQPIGNYSRTEQDSYPWLRGRTPIAVIGHSIFVFKIE